ncbi:MAG: phosphatase PAP2 family protein [Ignavibacteria bacterium]|nr:phosphatase PAP2 family protein [Ignavibacteria bacterium]MDP3582877.1 phosphatase PAP2 family protein [Ignavibacteria bacterium]
MRKQQVKGFRIIWFTFLMILILGTVKPVYSQSTASDSSFHPYNVNYWVTGSILTVGLTTNLIGITTVLGKKDVTLAEIQSLDKSVINNLDYWVLKLDPTKASANADYSDYVLGASLVMPGLLFFDKSIKHDWFDILLMYTETMSITTNIFEWSFLGPTFQNRLRPLTYYEELTYDEKKSGHNRNSFYSGHVASAAASTFFMAKVYSDYHPEIGNNKYLLYAAAIVPPLVLGYFRIKALKHFTSDVMVGIGIGALCGILIPELHRIKYENISLGMYSSSEATGIAIQWQPKF